MDLEMQPTHGDEVRTSLRGKSIAIVNLREAEAKFDKTGTADVLLGQKFGVSVKNEGDFVHVRFGSKDLTPIGSVPSGARNFATKQEAFEFVEDLQSQIIQQRAPLGKPVPLQQLREQ
jgi:hypothetical protein